MLTVGVVLLPDPVHAPVGFDPQEKASVFTVQPLGLLEAPGREAAAAAVLRHGGERGDFSGGHLLPSAPLRLLLKEAETLCVASHRPPSLNPPEVSRPLEAAGGPFEDLQRWRALLRASI